MNWWKQYAASAALAAALATGTAQAADKEVVFACWGGASQQVYENEILSKFEEMYDVDVKYIPGASTYFTSQLQAQRANPEIDVVCMDDGPQSVARELGLLAPVTPDMAPSLADALPAGVGKDNIGVGYGLLAMGIVYNREALEGAGIEPPKSWNDLADPRFKDRIALGSIDITPGLFTLVMLAKANGGGVDNIEPGFEKMKEVAENVAVFSKASDMTQYFQQGEAWVSVWTNSEMGRFVKSSGFPLEFVYPEDGTPIVMPMLSLVKDGPNPELGVKLIDFLMSPDMQAFFAERSRLGPVNQKVELSSEVSEGIVYGDAVDSLVAVDWGVINDKRAEWTDRWNREIER